MNNYYSALTIDIHCKLEKVIINVEMILDTFKFSFANEVILYCSCLPRQEKIQQTPFIVENPISNNHFE